MSRPEDSLLGREVAYPRQYDPSLLFPIPRATGRQPLRLAGALPFTGHDRWHGYELGWLDARGKPQVACATFTLAADSPFLLESKSFKLYLNSLNATRFASAEALRTQVEADLSAAAKSPVTMHFGLPPVAVPDIGIAVQVIDAQPIAIDDYGPPNAGYLRTGQGEAVEEVLVSHLFKSNCPVTGQPDWASVYLHYRGARIEQEGLLRYLVSFRDHRGFHEQCVEQIFLDLLRCCAPAALSVQANYTRRGGLDINPWRATPGMQPLPVQREVRQ